MCVGGAHSSLLQHHRFAQNPTVSRPLRTLHAGHSARPLRTLHDLCALSRIWTTPTYYDPTTPPTVQMVDDMIGARLQRWSTSLLRTPTTTTPTTTPVYESTTHTNYYYTDYNTPGHSARLVILHDHCALCTLVTLHDHCALCTLVTLHDHCALCTLVTLHDHCELCTTSVHSAGSGLLRPTTTLLRPTPPTVQMQQRTCW